MTTHTDLHPLAHDYLERLTHAARGLDPHHATELVTDISEHLHEALRPGASEAEVRTVLDRLGTPDELVVAAGGSPQIPARANGLGRIEIGALVCLVGAEILFVIAPLAAVIWLGGIGLLVGSRVWSGRQKAWGLASLATGFPLVFLAFFGTAPATVTICTSGAGTGPATCTSEGGWPSWVFTMNQVLLVAYLVLQVWTLWRLTRRR